MLAKLKTFSLLGIDALPVEVEVDVSPGALPKTVLVGLPEAAVKESTHRVERAIVIAAAGRHNLLMLWPIRPVAEIFRETPYFTAPTPL
jgi:magnesium chelatase family protein